MTTTPEPFTAANWRDGALCAQTDPEAFFPEKGQSPRPAKHTCLSCEVRAFCLGWALEHNETHGVWGGLSTQQRRRLRRQRRTDTQNAESGAPEAEAETDESAEAA